MSTKAMPYVRLGKSGLKVSKIILGCMSYGTKEWQGGWVLPEEQGVEHIKVAYDSGINTFDTANVYSDGVSEVILGKAIKKHNLPREEIVVMTKVFFTAKRAPETIIPPKTPEDYSYVNQRGLSRKHIFDSVAHSLKRLQLDYIDVLQCHRFDPETPIEETMQALHDVVQAGYVRYIGMSSCWAWQFHVMQNYAIQNRLTPFISMQNHYNLVYREEESEMMPTLKHFGVGCIPWSPLARGLLTRPNEQGGQTAREGTDQYLKFYTDSPGIVDSVEKIAKKKGASMAQIALAWLLNKEGEFRLQYRSEHRSDTVTVIATRCYRSNRGDHFFREAEGSARQVPYPHAVLTSTELRETGAVQINLDSEEMKELEQHYGPRPVFGHE